MWWNVQPDALSNWLLPRLSVVAGIVIILASVGVLATVGRDLFDGESNHRGTGAISRVEQPREYSAAIAQRTLFSLLAGVVGTCLFVGGRTELE